MKGLSLFVDGELFAVDVTLVQKVVKNINFTPIPAAPPAVAGITNIKSGIVTILNLIELLGREKKYITVNAVIFKSFTNGNDQMGLLIDKPGNLLDIEDNIILPPPLAEEEEIMCISGVAEVGGKLYRIIDVNKIMNFFINGKKSIIDNNMITQGGTNDVQKN